ncbi:antibiotic biosynthesis monooxygenase family protein [Actinoplanes sp. NPDC051851]|uniref:antibiotic biosynthesis monooxygenase family protein n=1 Tax=Actinoplanes sp. NPDC051851 TaxID=3154753 RepID=UPI003448E237
MSIEITYFTVKAGREEEFVTVFAERAIDYFIDSGATDIRIHRSVTDPTRFVKTSVWESREARLTNFSETQRHQDFVALIGPYLAGPPTVDDYDVAFPS